MSHFLDLTKNSADSNEMKLCGDFDARSEHEIFFSDLNLNIFDIDDFQKFKFEPFA